MAPRRAVVVRAARPPRSVYASNMGSSTAPMPGIWKRWSMTQTESKPADSAVVAMDTTFSNRPPS